MDKRVIEKNFSRYARLYDSYCAIQDLSARDLIAYIEDGGFDSILDIGCGTGNYTMLLRDRFPQSAITALDISGEMITLAGEKLKDINVEFIIKDAERLVPDKRFGLITSNAALQWFDDIEGTLVNYKELLKPKGTIAFSIFGPDTFNELGWSLKELFKKEVAVDSFGFTPEHKVKTAMERNFKDVVIKEKIYKESYKSLKRLLENIKYTGTTGSGAGLAKPWTHKMIDDLEKIYLKKFGEISATYQVFFCRGKR